MSKLTTVELPEELALEATEAARAAGETLASLVARAIAFEIERGRTDGFFARRARSAIAEALGILNREGGQPPEPSDELPPGYKRTC